MDHMIVRRYGHFADIVMILLAHHGTEDYLSEYIMQLALLSSSGLEKLFGLRNCGKVDSIRWSQN
jgi:hypothetical protein